MAHLSAADCAVAVRVQLAKVFATPAFQQKVASSVDALLAVQQHKEAKLAGFQAFLKEAGIRWQSSFSEVGICVAGSTGGQWAVLLGGDVKPDTIVPALLKHNFDHLEPMRVGGLVGAGRARDGIVEELIVQLPDGTTAVAEEDTLLAKLAAPIDPSARVRLDGSHDVGFVVSMAATKELLATGENVPEEIRAIRGLEGSYDVGPGTLVVRIDVADPKSAKKLDALLTKKKVELEKAIKEVATIFQGVTMKSLSSKPDGATLVIEWTIPTAVTDSAFGAMKTDVDAMKSRL